MPGISFDRAVEYYDETRGYNAGSGERVRDAIVALAGAGTATHFLELGVGTGRIALPFIRAGYNYTGVDISRQMMDRLEAKIAADAQAGYRYELREADITAMPFADATFDVAIGVHVLHLVSDWQATVREARRVLRPNGVLVIGYDQWQDMHLPEQPAAQSETARVRTSWEQIQRDLGLHHAEERLQVRNSDSDLVAYCESLGAHTKRVRLAEVERAAVSPRGMAERLKGRLYSADWQTPDELHAEASRRLDEWFTREISAPDEPVAQAGYFGAILVRWPKQAELPLGSQ